MPFSFVFTAHVFLTNMSEKRTSTSRCAIQVKDQRMTTSTEEKLDPIADLKNVNKFLTYAIMVDSLIVAYIQFVIMLVELKEVLYV
jgi:hypothetical protein